MRDITCKEIKIICGGEPKYFCECIGSHGLLTMYAVEPLNNPTKWCEEFCCHLSFSYADSWSLGIQEAQFSGRNTGYRVKIDEGDCEE